MLTPFPLKLVGVITVIVCLSICKALGGSIEEKDKAIKSILTVGKASQSRLTGNSKELYIVEMEKGQFLSLKLDQQGIDVKITAYLPNGNRLIEIDAIPSLFGLERLQLISPVTGGYKIEVAAVDKVVSPGEYSIEIETLRTAQDEDVNRAETFQKLWDGINDSRSQNRPEINRAIEKLTDVATAWQKLDDKALLVDSLRALSSCYKKVGNKQQAMETINQAVIICRSINAQQREAYCLRDFGLIYHDNGEFDKAQEQYAQALEIYRRIGDYVGEADVLNQMGSVYRETGKLPLTIEYFEKALEISKNIGLKKTEGNQLSNLGVIFSQRGEQEKAIDYLTRAIDIKRELGETVLEANALNILAGVYNDIGETDKAIELCQRSLALLANKDKLIESSVHNFLGIVYVSKAEYQKALDSLNIALKQRTEINDKFSIGVTINNIGTVYAGLGDFKRALKYYEMALAHNREINRKNAESISLYHIGTIYSRRGQNEKAIEYMLKSMELAKLTGLNRLYCLTQIHIGELYRGLGDIEKSLEYLNKGLELARMQSDKFLETTVLNNLGKVYYQRGELEKALDLFNQSAQKNEQRFRQLDLISLSGIIRIDVDKGRLEEANAKVDTLLSRTEFIRAGVLARDLRIYYSSLIHDFYQLAIDISMRLHKQSPDKGYLLRAISLAEQLRSRNLIELLAESNTNITQGVEARLIERERELKQSINVKYEKLARLHNRKDTQPQQAALQSELEKQLTDYYSIQAEIRAKSPRYAGVSQLQQLDIKALQEVIDDNTLLLEYSLGKDRSFLWVVAKDSLNSYELPGQGEIEKAARNFYELLTARSRRVKFERSEEKQRRIAAADAQLSAASRTLSELVLGPAAQLLGTKRLLIVADGALNYVPFAALPTPKAKTAGLTAAQSNQPLIIEHEIINLPSALTLLTLRKESATRQPAANKVIVFADPVFGNTDERAANKTIPPTDGDLTATRFIEQFDPERAERADLELPRLPFTSKEAEAIGQVAGKSSRLLLGYSATLAAALSPELKNYQIVHFGTHGIFNADEPQLSSLVLSLINEKGETQPGFLTANQVYNLNLSADLAVLSACQTGLGEEVKGEGIVGLTRGFFYAGAARVLVSLWAVNDASTSELMSRFYKILLKSKPLRPAAALREAQISMLRNENWSEPFYWAAFQVHGDIDAK